jgi:nucleotidyltransferase AbiEii toxin of type IV toxin-antitoxin system
MPSPARDTAAGRIYNDLRNLARRTGAPTDQVMLEYLLERFLYRVSIHPLGQQHFVLKGGLLLAQFGARRVTRDYADLHQLITRHHLDGDELTTALRNTASHRGIQLRPLSEAISDLPTRRQAPYTAWRRRQGHAAENHPATFADLVATVTTFADPWLPAPYTAVAGTPPPEPGRLHSRIRDR